MEELTDSQKINQLEYTLQRRDLEIQAILEDLSQSRKTNAEYRVDITLLEAEVRRLSSLVPTSVEEKTEDTPSK